MSDRGTPVPYKVLFSGSRTWRDEAIVHMVIDDCLAAQPGLAIVHGDHDEGVDRMVRRYCERLALPEFRCPAKWRDQAGNLDRSAGPRRNQWMLDYFEPYKVIAFREGGRASRGTTNMILAARKAGLDVMIVEPKENGRYAIVTLEASQNVHDGPGRAIGAQT